MESTVSPDLSVGMNSNSWYNEAKLQMRRWGNLENEFFMTAEFSVGTITTDFFPNGFKRPMQTNRFDQAQLAMKLRTHARSYYSTIKPIAREDRLTTKEPHL